MKTMYNNYDRWSEMKAPLIAEDVYMIPVLFMYINYIL